MRNYYQNESQQLLNRNIRGLGIAAILFLYLFVFSPLWFTAYIITEKLLPKSVNGMYQLFTIGIISYGIYCLIFAIKGMLLYLKGKGNLMWFPLFIFCIIFTCLPPGIITYNILHRATPAFITLVFSFVPAIFIYVHYNFLRDEAPLIARFAYHAGIWLVWFVGKRSK